MSRDINRFNGKYLKCVITPNITSTDVLKNSGSLIVYHPSLPFSQQRNNITDDNYLYKYVNDNKELTSNYIMSSLISFSDYFDNYFSSNINEENIGSFSTKIIGEIVNGKVTTTSEFNDKISSQNAQFEKLISQFSINNTDEFSTFTISPWSVDNRNLNDQIYSLPNLQSLDYKTDKNNVNYLFLGNEFIASGYGFRTIEERDKISWLSENYKSIFKTLYELNHLNYKLFENACKTIVPLLDRFVKIDGGDVSNTIVYVNEEENIVTNDPNNTKVNLIDLLMPGVEASYDDIIIDTVEIKINGNSTTNNIIELPIGSSLSSINVILSGRLRDAGNIDSVTLSYNYMTGDKNSIQTQTVTSEVYNDTKTDTFYIDYTVNYSRVNNISQVYYVTEGLQDIINNIKIHVTGTPTNRLKYYPELYNEKQIKIISDGNKIYAKDIELQSPIKINGVYPVFYSMNNMPIIGNYTASELNQFITKTPDTLINVSKQNLNKTIIKNDLIELDILKDTKYLFLAIPTKYKVYKVEYEDGINHFVHNWTGCLKVYNTDENVKYENMFSIDGRVRYLRCNVYLMIMSSGIKISGKLRVYVHDSTNMSQTIEIFNSETSGNDNNINQSLLNEITYNEENVSYIQNPEFNATYWLTSDYKKENYDFYLDTYLKNFRDNGAN